MGVDVLETEILRLVIQLGIEMVLCLRSSSVTGRFPPATFGKLFSFLMQAEKGGWAVV